jgi:hypothetical protein
MSPWRDVDSAWFYSLPQDMKPRVGRTRRGRGAVEERLQQVEPRRRTGREELENGEGERSDGEVTEEQNRLV